VTKAQAASENAESGKKPAPGEQATTGEFPAVADEPEADEPEDVFKEIPTVANRANPTAAPGTASPAAPPAPPEGSGSYRILRPLTSDIIDTPTTTKVDGGPSKRMVLSPARKPK